MTRSRSTLKALGLCAFVACLLTIPASAQATGWMVNGVNDTEWGANLKPTIEGEFVGGKKTILTTIVGLKVELTCTKIEFIGVYLEKGGNLNAEGKAKSTGCNLLINGKATTCEPHSAGQPAGTIIATGTGRIGKKESGEKPVVTGLVQPIVVKEEKEEKESKIPFVTIQMSEECAIGEEIPVTGMFGYRDVSAEESELEKVVHEIQEYAPNSSLTVLGNPATIDGATAVELTGAHTGLKFSLLK